MSEFADFPEDTHEEVEINDSSSTDKLFLDSKNHPYRFFISHDEPDLIKLAKLIDDNGGEVYNEITPEDLAKDQEHINSIIPIASSLSFVEQLRGPIKHFYKPEFIYESVEKGTTLRLDEFRIDTPDEEEDHSTAQHKHESQFEVTTSGTHGPSTPGLTKLISKRNFSAEEDAFIISMARRNPHSIDSKYLFLAIQERLSNHTVASIRSRFRNKLKNDVEFFYKVKSNGEIIRDSNGNYIVDNSNAQIGVKALYKAREDYVLCKYLSKQELGPSPSNPNNLAVVTYHIKNFFNFMSKKYPSHSMQSWRDRYRKFAVPKGILEYLQYYELVATMGEEPKNLNQFNEYEKEQAKERYQQFLTTKRENNESIPLFVPPDEEEEAQQDDEDDDIFLSPLLSPGAMVDTDQAIDDDLYQEQQPTPQSFEFDNTKKRRPLKRPVLNMSPIPSDELKAQVEKLETTPLRPVKRARKISAPPAPPGNGVVMDFSGPDTTIVEAPITPQQQQSQQQELPQVFELTEESQSKPEQQQEQVESLEQEHQEEEPHFVPELESQDEQEEEEEEEEQQQFSESHQTFTADTDQISSDILSSMTRSEFLNKVVEIANESEDTEELILSLKKTLGISDTLSSDAIMAVSGDTSVFVEYLRIYLETGENPPVGVPGIWTREYDDIIWDKDNKEGLLQMIKLHNKKRCKHRRRFLEELKKNQESQ